MAAVAVEAASVAAIARTHRGAEAAVAVASNHRPRNLQPSVVVAAASNPRPHNLQRSAVVAW
jgi:hypothetical protein